MSADGPTELKIYQPSAASVAGAYVQGMAAYEALVQEANDDYPGFWARQARELISWKTPFTQVLDESNAPFFKWFADGTLNASYNCLDRNIERGLGDKTAIIFEADGGEVSRTSYRDLLERTCQIANGMKSLGIAGEFGQSAYVAEELYQHHGLTSAKMIEAAQALMK